MTKYNIAIVGATGAVGREMLQLLSERNFPYNNVHAVASRRSIGKEISFGDIDILKSESLDSFDFSKIDIAIFSAGSAVAKNFAPIALKKGCYVIDNSSAFREEIDIPLIVPEINAGSIAMNKLIANPNCIAIPLTLTLNAFVSVAEIKRVVVSSYQSVSGAGKNAMDELFQQSKSMMSYGEIEPKIFPKRIAFNIIPQIGNILDDGNSEEEDKIIKETKKILNRDIKVSATCVRVPVFVGHSMSANIEFEEDFNLSELEEALIRADGINYQSDDFITPIEIVKSDNVAISRLRRDSSLPNAINVWIVGDNLRKGAALNAIQIAEEIIK